MICSVGSIGAGKNCPATAGSDYNPKTGAECPRCRTAKSKIARSMPWVEDQKLRYHKCQNCGFTFKSVQRARDEEDFEVRIQPGGKISEFAAKDCESVPSLPMNPSRAAPSTIDNFPDRRYFCSYYSICLDVAIRKKWESFDCSSCNSFQSVTWDPAEALEDAFRCQTLIRVATKPSAFRWFRIAGMLAVLENHGKQAHRVRGKWIHDNPE